MRLYSTHLQQLSLFSPQEEHAPSPPPLNCVLQCESLSQAQEVEVRLNGLLQQGYQEEIYQVFAWQAAPQALMEVQLRSKGRPLKWWRGCWDGQSLCHGGTLALEVLLEQEVVAPSSTPPPALARPREDASSNGHHPDVLPVISASPAKPESLPSVTFGDEDLVVLVAGQPLASLPERTLPPVSASPAPSAVEPLGASKEEEDDLWTLADAARRHNPSELGEGEDDEEVWGEEEERDENEEALEDTENWDEAEEGNDEEVAQGGRENHLDRAEEAEAPDPVVPVTVQLATFHAGQGVPFASLLDLMGRMPPNTVVVDLRLHPKRGVATTVFSKEALRARFGALYWDRGALIQRTLTHASGHWRTVITNLDDPQGVAGWLPSLQQGVSMVFLDEQAVYAESVRAAVLTYLRAQPQLPHLLIVSEA